MAGEINKIFGIGVSRTGTTSLAYALMELGFKTAHYVFDESLYTRAQALVDSPVFADFEQLDHQYPGSRFVYTNRDPDRWVASFRDRLLDSEMGQREATRNPQHPTAEMNQRVYRQLFGQIDDLTDQVLRDGYLRHQQRVMNYFESRLDDLLVITIDQEDGATTWNRLCGFLDVAYAGAFPCFSNPSAKVWNDVEHPNKVI